MDIDNELFDKMFEYDIPHKGVKCVSKDYKLYGIQQALTLHYINEMNQILELSNTNKRVEDQVKELMIEKICEKLAERMKEDNIKCFNILKGNEMISEESEDRIVYFRITIKCDEILNLNNNFL